MSRKLALIIGNSDYDDAGLARLLTPGADVTGLAEVLREPEIGGFHEVTALVNQSVAAVRRAIASFFVDRERDDLLLLYFSGHGLRDDRGQLYLAVKDTERPLLRGTALPAGFITEEMDNSRSRRQVLILDCCHSGAFSRGMKGAPGLSVGTASAFEGTGSGRVVLTASDATQYAWEGDQLIGQAEHSVFTQYLIQGLRSGAADIDADGRITLDELYDYVYAQVVHETPKQTPSKWSYGQQGEIIIARNPRPVVKPAALPPELQQSLDDARPWVREGAVRELDRLLRGASPSLALAAREALARLAEDDSRRVASAAVEVLKSFAQSLTPAESPLVPAAAQPAHGVGAVLSERGHTAPQLAQPALSAAQAEQPAPKEAAPLHQPALEPAATRDKFAGLASASESFGRSFLPHWSKPVLPFLGGALASAGCVILGFAFYRRFRPITELAWFVAGGGLAAGFAVVLYFLGGNWRRLSALFAGGGLALIIVSLYVRQVAVPYVDPLYALGTLVGLVGLVVWGTSLVFFQVRAAPRTPRL